MYAWTKKVGAIGTGRWRELVRKTSVYYFNSVQLIKVYSNQRSRGVAAVISVAAGASIATPFAIATERPSLHQLYTDVHWGRTHMYSVSHVVDYGVLHQTQLMRIIKM